MRKKESEVHLTYGIAVTPYVITKLACSRVDDDGPFVTSLPPF